jgi:hypothetical protein
MTLYAIRAPSGVKPPEDAEVLEELQYGWDFLEQTITLWRLVDDKRADELQALEDRVVKTAEDGEIRFDTPDLHDLVALIDRVNDAIVAAGIVDHDWRIPAEQLEALARRVPAMDLKTERSLKSKTSALAEIMINADSLRNFLEHALSEGCVVVNG